MTQQNPALWQYALPLHKTICAKIGDNAVFRNATKATFAQGLQCTNPIETMQAFLAHIGFLRETFEPAYFQEYVVCVLLVNCFDKNNSTLQQNAFSVLCAEDSVRSAIDSQKLLDTIIPKACKEACKNADANVKVHALYFLSLCLTKMDKSYIAKNILPSLK